MNLPEMFTLQDLHSSKLDDKCKAKNKIKNVYQTEKSITKLYSKPDKDSIDINPIMMSAKFDNERIYSHDHITITTFNVHINKIHLSHWIISFTCDVL